MKVTKKTRLLAELPPIVQTADGAIKIKSVKDGGQSESFTWGHEWAVRGSGFPVDLPPDDWSLQAVQVYLHGDETDRYDIDLDKMTERAMTIRTADWGKPEGGVYPDAIIRFDFAKAGHFEFLKIPIKLVVP